MSEAKFEAKVLTLFGAFFPGVLDASLLGKARAQGLWSLDVVDLRAFAQDKHRSVDGTPFGGGSGMVLRPDVVDAALCAHHVKGRPLIYLSPRGRLFDQHYAASLAQEEGVTMLCGRYEGVDQRVLDAWNIEEVSIGDYILAGGELAAMVMLETIIRLRPDVLGNANSLRDESFKAHLLEYPQYTTLRDFKGYKVPDVLLSGNHADIDAWRHEKACQLTKQRRKDLWQKHNSTPCLEKKGRDT